ncbi:MAG: alanine racemase [Lentisphaeria bacterium]|nr:alanine racemase [Lentisphaeria bacterium]
MSRVVCKIDLGQLKRNLAVVKKHAADCRIMPVLKYDAYGMGADAVCNTLRTAGIRRYAVATLDEALALRTAGVEVQLLSGMTADEIPGAVAAGFILPVCDSEMARRISAEAVRQQRQVRVTVKLDTGMGRLGFLPETEMEQIVSALALPGICRDGICAHFAVADEPDMEFSRSQIFRFCKALTGLNEAGFDFVNIHHAASDGLLNIPEAVMPPFNLVRAGCALYGKDFSGECRQIISLDTTIVSLRQLPAGATVGYGRTFTAKQAIRTAVIPAGYADGVPLFLSNRGHVLVRGTACPVIGRVSMDYTVIDVSALPPLSAGEKVTLLGQDGEAAITVADWAAWKGSHHHDIWCAIGNRVKRIYSE